MGGKGGWRRRRRVRKGWGVILYIRRAVSEDDENKAGNKNGEADATDSGNEQKCRNLGADGKKRR